MKHDPQEIGVIFDMDGLLLDTERVCMECFVLTQKKVGIPEDQSVFLQCVGLNGQKSEEIISAHLPNNIELAVFLELWDDLIGVELTQGVRCRTGAETLIPALAKSGVIMGVATSTQTARARQHLEDAGLLPYLSCVVGGDAVMRHKPDPEVYHTVAGKIGRDIKACFCNGVGLCQFDFETPKMLADHSSFPQHFGQHFKSRLYLSRTATSSQN